jgi:hypothetical protein
VAGSSGGAASAVALGSGGADAMGGSADGVDGVDFGCHFLRSGTGGASVGKGCGLARVVAMG